MKRFFRAAMMTLVALTFMTSVSMASQGGILFDGDVGFSMMSGDAYENADGDGQTYMALGASVGYFVIDNLTVGGTLEFARMSWGDVSSQTIGIGPEVAYYFGTEWIEKSVHPFVKGAFIYKMVGTDDGTDSYSDKVMSFGASVGALYMFTESLGFFGEAGFMMDKWSFDEDLDLEDVDGTKIMVKIGLLGMKW
ncbi:MAG: hypothetical protein JW819_13840 [Candidatus Krumholzibacteriota bacterium]|nr:hypothetical protein [Candidatus Krumholzibacteriota bacterium]